jgi:hypothetical protein
MYLGNKDIERFHFIGITCVLYRAAERFSFM